MVPLRVFGFAAAMLQGAAAPWAAMSCFAATFGAMHPALPTMLHHSDRTTGLRSKSCIAFYPRRMKRTTTNRGKFVIHTIYSMFCSNCLSMVQGVGIACTALSHTVQTVARMARFPVGTGYRRQ